jgi:hypothetical protein
MRDGVRDGVVIPHNIPSSFSGLDEEGKEDLKKLSANYHKTLVKKSRDGFSTDLLFIAESL